MPRKEAMPQIEKLPQKEKLPREEALPQEKAMLSKEAMLQEEAPSPAETIPQKGAIQQGEVFPQEEAMPRKEAMPREEAMQPGKADDTKSPASAVAFPGHAGTANEPVTVTVSFAGDCTIGYDETFSYEYSFPHRLEIVGNDYSYFFRNVKPVFEKDDLTLVNLETTFTDSTKKAQKTFRFKGAPGYVNILNEGSVEMVNISNNHIKDYLDKGFSDTLDILDEAGILYCGEGHVAYYEAKGIIIACLGYLGWNASITDKIKKDLSAAAEKSDILIVSFHWGSEYSYYPDAAQKKLARFCIDNGADIVVGHHPHVIQGIENYKDGYIVYSLGNFCFGGNRNPKDKDTFIFQAVFTFKDEKITAIDPVIIPCSISSVDWINDYQPTILEGDERNRVLKRLSKYSAGLKWGMNISELETE
jgi:poly-gamma-glutamate synthesis protein (capsule biosynthesis protein)